MRHARQKGFSLITAVFLITVLASFGAFLVAITGVAQQTPVLGANGAQAYHAARSGLEWGIAGAINDDSTASCTGNFALGQFDVTVNCTVSAHGGVNVYVIDAVATTGTPGRLDFATRRMRATASPP